MLCLYVLKKCEVLYMFLWLTDAPWTQDYKDGGVGKSNAKWIPVKYLRDQYIDSCFMSREQYFSYFHEENKFTNDKLLICQFIKRLLCVSL
jgi:hypothetical protein